MKLTMHPKANVPVSIGECKSALAVHLAVSPPANVDIAIFPSEGALAIKIPVPEITDVQRPGVGRPMMPRTFSPSLIESPGADKGVTVIGVRHHWAAQHQKQQNQDAFHHLVNPGLVR